MEAPEVATVIIANQSYSEQRQQAMIDELIAFLKDSGTD
jgi:hypothetical protein